jgi:hypothetical protein
MEWSAPVPADKITWHDWEGSFPHDSGSDWSQRQAFNAICARSLTEQLVPLRMSGPLAADDFPLICVLRNEQARLPLFFRHYKGLGITRFFMIDNDSTDGSRDLLLAEAGVDVFSAPVPFQEGRGGIYWANGLAQAHCRGHWVLRVDTDELLVYDGVADHPLPHLARLLQATGFDRLYAPMLDIYSSAPFGAKTRDVEDILANDSWFDSEGYDLQRWREGWHLGGGARARLFNREGNQYWLSKYPFVRMDGLMTIVNQHYLWPFDTVTKGPMGALLHLKLTDDFPERSAAYAREKQHAFGSQVYRMSNEVMKDNPGMTAMHAQSRRYRGPKSLLRHRFILPLDWSKL